MNILKKIFIRLKTKLLPSDFDHAVYRWNKDNGDKTLRLDYPLNSDSIIFDLGGYEGQFTSDIFSRYLCKCYIFEPVSKYYKYILKRFEKNDKVYVFPFGLAAKDETCSIYINNDGSSMYKKSAMVKQNAVEHMELRSFGSFIEQNDIKHIDLIKINIEGAEYDLLDYIINEGLINIINNLQIQFHDVEIKGGAKNRMLDIQQKLEETHQLTWYYRPFVWENWTRKLN